MPVPETLLDNDPIVARYFFLDIDDMKPTALISVSGLDIEMDVVSVDINGKSGKQDIIKTAGGGLKVPDITVTRMAPPNSTQDDIWKWFEKIRKEGFGLAKRASHRKNGSIIMYDSSYAEVSRFNFNKGWPSKISTDSLSTDSNEAVKETITIVCERLDRVK